MSNTKKIDINSPSSEQHPDRLTPHVKVSAFGALMSTESAEVKALSSAKANKTPSKPEVAAQIGRQLRSVYNDVLSQPVPDRFLDLLRELDLHAGQSKETK